MRSSSKRFRFASRVDVRLAAALAGWTTLLLAVVLVAFVLLSRDESLEGLSVGIRRELRGVKKVADASSLEGARFEGISRDLEARGIALRVIAADGSARALGRPWPAEADCIRAPHSLATASRAKRSDFLVRSVAGGQGLTLEAAASLAHFVSEREETNEILIATLFGGFLLAGAAAGPLARRALAPLTAATRAIERVDENHLDARLPVRGTNDLVDRHAEAVNLVLSRMSWAFERIRAFSGDVAHELRTPINRILSLGEVAGLENASEGERAEALARIQAGALAMGKLVDSLLLLSKGEEGQLRMHASPLDLADLLLALADLYRPTCEDRDIDLMVEFDVARVNADAQLLSQCLSNLLDNALRYSPAGKPIRLSLSRRTSMAIICVEDSGPGIPAEDRDRIFERFVQLDPSRSSGRAGLGLSVARMLVRLHGGELSVGDSDLGGACFEITLPA